MKSNPKTHIRRRRVVMMVSSETADVERPHIVLFPVTTMGHTIPLIDLAHLLLKRGVTITIFTSSLNSSFVLSSLENTEAKVIQLSGGTSEDQLPENLHSMSSFMSLMNSHKLLQPHFEEALQTLPNVGCVISDAFLDWTLQSASKFNIPRISFYGMSGYISTIYHCVHKFGLDSEDGGTFSLPCFPSIRFTRWDLGLLLKAIEDKDAKIDFMRKIDRCTAASQGLLVNSFYELEAAYADYWNKETGSTAWYVGPLCMNQHHRAQAHNNPTVLKWLDEKLTMGRSVLYIAFGTQAEVSEKQLQEIAVGLERSGVNFFWVMRWKADLGDGFEERVAERGLVVREWVEQKEILGHDTIGGFMSHCGWNSILESICAKVPILGWPMMAEQHMNAKMLAEEMRIGLRIPGETGDFARVVGCEIVKEMVRELMVGEKGKVVRERVKEVGEQAAKAMEEGGSSYCTLDLLIDEFCRKK